MINIRVAVIDSGINTNINYLRDRITGGLTYIYNEKMEVIKLENSYEDDNGHGTNCCQVIYEGFQEVEFYIIKILNKNNETSSSILIRALEHLLTVDVKVICLSLATYEEEAKEPLNIVINKLYNQGKILVSSLGNNQLKSYPASLKNVIGVNGGRFCNNKTFWYNMVYDIQCVADYSPIICRSINLQYQIFKGNSKANALFTSHILQVMKDTRAQSFDEINSVLFHQAKVNQWSRNHIKKIIPYNLKKVNVLFYKGEKYRCLVELIQDVFKINNIDVNKPLWELGIGIDELKKLVECIKINLKPKVEKDYFYLNDFTYIDNLYYKLYGRG